MSTRGDLTRLKILDTARALFAEKGYAAVAMEDIRVLCGLSRGGLYRHFSSTKEIFTRLIETEQKNAFAKLEKALRNEVPGALMLDTFLRDRIKHLFNPKEYIDNAVNEFAASCPEGRELIVKRAEYSVDIVAEMIRLGCEQGAYSCEDCRATALHIICLLEGLAKHNALIPMTAQETEKQLEIIENMLK